MLVRFFARASCSSRFVAPGHGPAAPSVVVFRFGAGLQRVRRSAGQRRPNESFKPTPHRGANHMADTACHVLHAPLQRGLTLVLGLVSGTVAAVAFSRVYQLALPLRFVLRPRGGGIVSHSGRASASDRASFLASTIILNQLRPGWRCQFSAARTAAPAPASPAQPKLQELL